MTKMNVKHETALSAWAVTATLFVPLLAGCVVEPIVASRPFDLLRFTLGAAAVGAAGALRWWVVATLGQRWTTRVIVVPGLPLVSGGPFAYLRHPNYLAVAVEVAALPLAVGAWVTAIAGTCAGVDPDAALAGAGFAGPDPTERLRGELAGQGFLELHAGRVRLSARGWPVADAIARRFLSACSQTAGPPPARE